MPLVIPVFVTIAPKDEPPEENMPGYPSSYDLENRLRDTLRDVTRSDDQIGWMVTDVTLETGD